MCAIVNYIVIYKYIMHIKEKQKKKKCKQKNTCAVTVKVQISAHHFLTAHIQ